MDSFDDAERLARQVQLSELQEEGTGAGVGGARAFRRQMYESLCLCRWRWPAIDRQAVVQNINRWRGNNHNQHQYHRAPPNTTLGDFLDRTEHAIESESVVTILETDEESRQKNFLVNKNNLFSDDRNKINDTGTALEAALADGDRRYFFEKPESRIKLLEARWASKF